MKQNLGIADRVIRVISAVVLVDLAVSHSLSGISTWAAWIISIIFLLTSTVGFCPVYRIFGIKTLSKK